MGRESFKNRVKRKHHMSSKELEMRNSYPWWIWSTMIIFLKYDIFICSLKASYMHTIYYDHIHSLNSSTNSSQIHLYPLAPSHTRSTLFLSLNHPVSADVAQGFLNVFLFATWGIIPFLSATLCVYSGSVSKNNTGLHGLPKQLGQI